jgi:hypothetical protein
MRSHRHVLARAALVAAGVLVLCSAHSAVLAATSPDPAAAPAVASPAPPPSHAEEIIGPLKEIGHVTARTPFCSRFVDDSALAASAAVSYEFALVKTARDLEHANTDDSLRKSHSAQVLLWDLQKLADLSNAGRAKLADLAAAAAATNDPELQKQVIDFRDALDGAKARQMELARKISSAVAKFEEDPVYSTIASPLDIQLGNSDGRSLIDFANKQSYWTAPLDPNSYWDQAMANTHYAAVHSFFESGPEDAQIGDDLERAGHKANLIVQLGKC